MRSFRYIIFGILLSTGIFSAVLYSSCNKDACKGVTCINNGTCGGGVCNCPTGVGGTNCERIYRKSYANTYKGIARWDIIHNDPDNTLAFNVPNDTSFSHMTLVWTNPGSPIISLPVTITNASANGANFTVNTTQVDTFTYTGTGSVNATTASLTLTKSHANGSPIVVYFNDFNKQ